MWILWLNNMRVHMHYEAGVIVCWSDYRETIIRLIKQEMVDCYTELKDPVDPDMGEWGKHFRKGILEWYNLSASYTYESSEDWGRDSFTGHGIIKIKMRLRIKDTYPSADNLIELGAELAKIQR